MLPATTLESFVACDDSTVDAFATIPVSIPEVEYQGHVFFVLSPMAEWWVLLIFLSDVACIRKKHTKLMYSQLAGCFAL